MAHNSMSHHAFRALGEILPVNTALKELRLSWNNCHGAGLIGFCKGLLPNKNVRRLDLSWNLLGRESQVRVTGSPAGLGFRVGVTGGGVDFESASVSLEAAFLHPVSPFGSSHNRIREPQCRP